MSIRRSGLISGGIFDVRFVTNWMCMQDAARLEAEIEGLGLDVEIEREDEP